MSDGDQQPVGTARKIAVFALGGILVALAIMLALVMWLGDPTNDDGDTPNPTPTPSPSSSGY